MLLGTDDGGDKVGGEEVDGESEGESLGADD